MTKLGKIKCRKWSLS